MWSGMQLKITMAPGAIPSTLFALIGLRLEKHKWAMIVRGGV